MTVRRLALISLACFSLAGCASMDVVQPTAEEMAAAGRFKKNVAILDISEDRSDIKGLKAITLSRLENYIMPYCDLVERDKVDRVLRERQFAPSQGRAQFLQLKELLDVDYVVFAGVYASVSGPRVQCSEYKTDEGVFSGTVWDEVDGVSELSVKIVDVNDGSVIYSGSKRGSCKEEGAKSVFSDEALFRQAVNTKSLAQHITQFVGLFTDVNSTYSTAVSRSLDASIHEFHNDFRKIFSQTGEVLQIVSEKDVLINLGSAYGLRPGDSLIWWNEYMTIVDPKTGIETVQKNKKEQLRVKEVTSGLTCIATGKKKVISMIKPGDKVYTY
ncbi:MAG: hypothetical protein ABH883_04435 [Candidatus Omnitrophota bacterium]